MSVENKKIVACEECQKPFNIFRWRHQCSSCERTLCSKCIPYLPELEWLLFNPLPYERLCRKCWSTIASPILSKYNLALDNALNVTTYPSTYMGKINIIEGSQNEIIETDYFKNRENAEKMLKVTAAFQDCDVIFGIEWQDKTCSTSTGRKGKGTYYYRVWRVVGTPAKKKG